MSVGDTTLLHFVFSSLSTGTALEKLPKVEINALDKNPLDIHLNSVLRTKPRRHRGNVTLRAAISHCGLLHVPVASHTRVCLDVPRSSNCTVYTVMYDTSRCRCTAEICKRRQNHKSGLFQHVCCSSGTRCRFLSAWQLGKLHGRM